MKSRELDHLYLHIPFCDGKCSYCAFYSEVYTPERADQYLDSLAMEFDLYLKEVGREAAPETIYFGGGTSSILNETQLERLCKLVRSRINPARLKEWSIETNPGSLTPAKIEVITDAGINRISIGAQSFDDEILQRIGRRHTAADIDNTLHEARKAGIENIGLDLIACLPGVYDKMWQAALEKAVSLNPAHVSVYALSVEKGTQLSRMVRSGDIVVPDDDIQLRTLDMAERILGTIGLKHYEISNYATPGRECMHNVSCWRGEDYLGLGPAGASRAGHRRWTNKPDIDQYVKSLSVGEAPPREEETLSSETDATERLIFGFRLSEGVDISQFAKPASPLGKHWETSLAGLAETGLTEKQDNRWLLTRQGRSLADFVAYELIRV